MMWGASENSKNHVLFMGCPRKKARTYWVSPVLDQPILSRLIEFCIVDRYLQFNSIVYQCMIRAWLHQLSLLTKLLTTEYPQPGAVEVEVLMQAKMPKRLVSGGNLRFPMYRSVVVYTLAGSLRESRRLVSENAGKAARNT